MGPGCFHPRNVHRYPKWIRAGRLQWGRDVFIPEISTTTSFGSQGKLLQWGRDVFIPEITNGKSPGAALWRFNGAGMFSSQKSRNSVERLVASHELQWGRDVFIPEMSQPLREKRKRNRASMGPGCFHPRNTSSSPTRT